MRMRLILFARTCLKSVSMGNLRGRKGKKERAREREMEKEAEY